MMGKGRSPRALLRSDRKSRGRVYDVILIFVLVFGIFALAARYWISAGEPRDTLTAEIEIEISGLAAESTGALAVGDTVILKTNGAVFGTVSQVSVSPQMRKTALPNGRVAVHPSQKLYTVTCRILCDGVFGEGGFFHDGKTHVGVNQTLSLYGQKIDFLGYVIGINAP